MFGLAGVPTREDNEDAELDQATRSIFRLQSPASQFHVDQVPYLTGSVYSVFRGTFGRNPNVLMKIARKNLISNERSHEHLVQIDIDVMQQLSDNPAFASIFHVQHTDTHVMLVVPEYHETLLEYIRTMRSRPVDELVDVTRLVKKLWKAVAYLHQQRLVHRDLRLKNIYLHRYNNGCKLPLLFFRWSL